MTICVVVVVHQILRRRYPTSLLFVCDLCWNVVLVVVTDDFTVSRIVSAFSVLVSVVVLLQLSCVECDIFH